MSASSYGIGCVWGLGAVPLAALNRAHIAGGGRFRHNFETTVTASPLVSCVGQL